MLAQINRKQETQWPHRLPEKHFFTINKLGLKKQSLYKMCLSLYRFVTQKCIKPSLVTNVCGCQGFLNIFHAFLLLVISSFREMMCLFLSLT